MTPLVFWWKTYRSGTKKCIYTMRKVLNSLQCFADCPPRRIGRSADRQALRLCENKKRIRLPAILRGRLQIRQAAKASVSQTERTTTPLHPTRRAGLCFFARRKIRRDGWEACLPTGRSHWI